MDITATIQVFGGDRQNETPHIALVGKSIDGTGMEVEAAARNVLRARRQIVGRITHVADFDRRFLAALQYRENRRIGNTRPSH